MPKANRGAVSIKVGDFIVYGSVNGHKDFLYEVMEVGHYLVVKVPPEKGQEGYRGIILLDRCRKATDVEVIGCRLRGTNELP